MRGPLVITAILLVQAPASAVDLPGDMALTLPAQDSADARRCMTDAIYYEAAREPTEGQEAVAQVVLNRLHDPRFPKTVCGVVYQGSHRATGCQFSFTCDGSLAREPSPTLWRRADAVAAQALASPPETSAGAATFYHADYVAPGWARQMNRVGQIGRHIFYQSAGKGTAAPRQAAAPASGAFQVWGLTVAYVNGRDGAVTRAPAAPEAVGRM